MRARARSSVVSEIVLTDEQNDAVRWMVEQVGAGTPVVALRGLAGTGKTSIIGHLRTAIEERGIGTALGAATHRAKMVLRRKGFSDSQTYHQHAMTPHFLGDYATAVEWFGEECPSFAVDHAKARPFVEDVPPLIHERLAQLPAMERRSPDSLKADWPRHRATAILRSIGIDGTKHISGWGPKDGVGCLIIDEASMLSADDLRICTEAFPSVVLVGDPGQLPPVTGEAVLHTVDGFELTQIQRQAQDSPIIQLAYAAREGQEFWKQLTLMAGAIERWQGVDAKEFLTAPLLVGKNTTRKACTHAIRAALGYPDYRPVVGEPIVCRMNDKKYKGGAFYNNALFRVVAVDESDHRKVRLRVEDSEDEHDISIHLEEIHGSNIALGAIQCRFGYVYTAHTAQGGEWPTVFISDPGLIEWRNALRYMKALDQFPKWSYTALTRAKTMVVFVQNHHFTTTIRPAIHTWEDFTMPRMQRTDTEATPPSAPMMNIPVDPREPDDIPDPVIPPATMTDAQEAPRIAAEAGSPPASVSPPSPPFALPDGSEALLRGFTQYMHGKLQSLMQDESLRIARAADVTIASMADYCKGVLQSKAYGANDLPDALRQLSTDGLKLMQAPYQVRISATSPHGFPVEFTLTKATAEEMIGAVTGLEQWLGERGYGKVTVGAAA
jgi:exodeoxyribonuclease-5